MEARRFNHVLITKWGQEIIMHYADCHIPVTGKCLRDLLKETHENHKWWFSKVASKKEWTALIDYLKENVNGYICKYITNTDLIILDPHGNIEDIATGEFMEGSLTALVSQCTELEEGSEVIEVDGGYVHSNIGPDYFIPAEYVDEVELCPAL